MWHKLNAGDGILMDQMTWHRGGANTSEVRRTLLAVSFVENAKGRGASGQVELGDFQDEMAALGSEGGSSSGITAPVERPVQ